MICGMHLVIMYLNAVTINMPLDEGLFFLEYLIKNRAYIMNGCEIKIPYL